jgi:hypothetical protein
MEYSHEKSWDCFEAILNEKLSIKDSWNKLIDYHEQIKPKDFWSSLRQLEVEKEQLDFKEWIEQTLKKSPIPKKVIALWIGITKLWDDKKEKEFYVVYIQGSNSYDVEDIDWATEPTFEPKNKYGIVSVLNQMDEIINTDADYSILDWIMPIAYCSFTIDELIRTNKLDKKLFLKWTNKMFVTTGFDDGDYMNLTSIE